MKAWGIVLAVLGLNLVEIAVAQLDVQAGADGPHPQREGVERGRPGYILARLQRAGDMVENHHQGMSI